LAGKFEAIADWTFHLLHRDFFDDIFFEVEVASDWIPLSAGGGLTFKAATYLPSMARDLPQ
jgi:hypothetical protein